MDNKGIPHRASRISRRSVMRGGAALLGAGMLGPVYLPDLARADVPAKPGLSRPLRDNTADVIRIENERPGTTGWMLTRVRRHVHEPYEEGWHRRKEIEAYVSHRSIRVGETLTIYVSTDPPDSYQIEIFRLGYYGGTGGRLLTTITPRNGSPPGKTQPTPADGENHLVECRWEESIRLLIPEDWVSGVYLGKLSTWRATESDAYVVFVVRDDRKADVMFQVSDLTWVAYNRWPQWRSLYDTPTAPWGSDEPDSYDAGFHRPYGIYWNGYPAGFEPLTNGSGEFLMTEFPLAYWLEKEGYDVTYVSNLDAHEDGPGIQRCKVFLSVGHDEYWTQEMFDNVARARDAGVNLAFLSGNSVSGRVELVPGADGRPRGIHLVDRGFDETDLMGAESFGVGFGDWICAAPDHWIYEGTGMKKGDRIPRLIGWEYHGPPLATRHRDLVVLAEGPVTEFNGGPAETPSYAATMYTAPRGNYVFNAGTCWWPKLLSTPPGYMNPPYFDFSAGDERVRQMTRNLLDRMIAVDVS